MTEKDMIEKAALAILNSDRVAAGLHPVDSREGIPDSDGYVRNVRAVAKAWEEPTDAMAIAAHRQIGRNLGPASQFDCKRAWKAMLSTILNEGEQ